jgi:carboxymethylenebutenolidase
MSHETIQIRTNDGVCPTHVFEPDEDGRWPAVLMFMDGLGIRPALFNIAERLSSNGYYVMLPDLYYRSGYSASDAATLFSDDAVRKDWASRVLPTVSIEKIMQDMPFFLAHLDAALVVGRGKIGTTGYCLGGRLSLAAAGHFPARIGAAASYHGGRLATDDADSPHRLAPQMTARVYVGGAIEDPGFDDAQKQRLEDALSLANVEHVIETYNARHGWVPDDTPVHDPAATERHWRTLLGLLGESLGAPS